MKKSVALFLDNSTELTLAINETENFQVVFATDDGVSAIDAVKTFKPDAIVCDIVLKNLDGLTLLEKISGCGAKIIVYSAFGSDDMIRSVKFRGADIYLEKPLSPEIIINRLTDLCGMNATADSADYDTAAELRVSNVFLSAGIPPHIKGYGFLRSGVILAMKDPQILGNITKQLYPKIAESYKTSPSKVERAIRHAIEVAWNRGRIENLNAIFGVNFYCNGDKPTNGEFIALVADRLIQERRMGKF